MLSDLQLRTYARGGAYAGNAYRAAKSLAREGRADEALRLLAIEAPGGVGGVARPEQVIRAMATRARRRAPNIVSVLGAAL